MKNISRLGAMAFIATVCFSQLTMAQSSVNQRNGGSRGERLRTCSDLVNPRVKEICQKARRDYEQEGQKIIRQEVDLNVNDNQINLVNGIRNRTRFDLAGFENKQLLSVLLTAEAQGRDDANVVISHRNSGETLRTFEGSPDLTISDTLRTIQYDLSSIRPGRKGQLAGLILDVRGNLNISEVGLTFQEPAFCGDYDNFQEVTQDLGIRVENIQCEFGGKSERRFQRTITERCFFGQMAKISDSERNLGTFGECRPRPIQRNDFRPQGHVDNANANGQISGWVFDKDNLSADIPLHVYVDGRGAVANISRNKRPDVDRAFSLGNPSGDYGYRISIEGYTCGNVDVYAIDPQDTSLHTKIMGQVLRPCGGAPAPAPAPGPAPTPRPSPQVTCANLGSLIPTSNVGERHRRSCADFRVIEGADRVRNPSESIEIVCGSNGQFMSTANPERTWSREFSFVCGPYAER